MEKVVIAAASNIDSVRRKNKLSRTFLNGAAIYAGYASSTQVDTRIISCVGEEKENAEIIERAKKYRQDYLPNLDIITIKGGQSFRQIFEETEEGIVVKEKDYGNYNDWNPDIQSFETDVLLLGTGNPIFQKAVLDSCIHASHILLDSKLIHFDIRADKMDEMLKRVDTFFGTKEEIEQLLKNCGLPLHITTNLFKKYPNLKVIVEKNNKRGGRVFLQNGLFYTYQPEIPVEEICSDGAGDVFAGTYAASLSKNESMREIIRKSAQSAANSVRYFGIDKIKNGLNIDKSCRIIIEESRWLNGRDEKSTDRGNK